jgi:hypothetical protein
MRLLVLFAFAFALCGAALGGGDTEFQANSSQLVKLSSLKTAENLFRFFMHSINGFAHIADLKQIEKVILPVRVNIAFVGFEGDGQGALRLTPQDLQPWFEHIEHIVPHTVVPLGEEQLTVDATTNQKSAVSYRVEINVIELDPLVNTIIEDVLLWNVREDQRVREDFRREMNLLPQHYVDPFKLTRVLNRLVIDLNIQGEYTLFVMHPKSPVEGTHKYGYRMGFAQQELTEIFNNPVLSSAVSKVEPTEEDGHHAEHADPVETTIPLNAHLTHTDLRQDSARWADAFLKQHTGVIHIIRIVFACILILFSFTNQRNAMTKKSTVQRKLLLNYRLSTCHLR